MWPSEPDLFFPDHVEPEEAKDGSWVASTMTIACVPFDHCPDGSAYFASIAEHLASELAKLPCAQAASGIACGEHEDAVLSGVFNNVDSCAEVALFGD